MKKRIMVVTSIVLLSILIVCAILLIICSPGKIKPIPGENGRPVKGSLSEKVFLNLGGAEQGMFIKSRDTANPVLLYLHGGMPDYFLTKKYPTGLEDLFTVVWWEQRGSGISFNKTLRPESMNAEQMIADTKELTNYLRKRFGKEKIYLMGHSGGTFIGIQTAQKFPELYHAYIGVAQMADQLKSEILAYDYMLDKFRESGHMKMVRKLEAAPVSITTGVPEAYRILRDPAMHSLGIGTTRDMKSVVTGIFLPSLACPEYTLTEKLNLWIGKSKSGISVLWDDMISTDLAIRIPELAIPVYFFEGIFDYTCCYSVAKSYFDNLKAPVKGFYTFDKSAHSPLFEEPEKMKQILLNDVLKAGNSLADSN